MMRGASAEALAELTDKVGSRGTLADAAALGDQLFGVAAVLRSEPALRRVLTDNAVEADAKSGLATSVFSSSLHEDTLALVTDAVRRRWTSSSDLPEAVAELAAIAVVHSAGAKARQVGDELFSVRTLVQDNPDLRSALADPSRSSADRSALLTGLLAGKAHEATIRLVTQAVGEEGSVDAALDRYQKLAARVQGERVAVVRSARPLSETDQDRLIQALGRQYATTVHLHVVVDPTLVGGLRVEIGDDVIDGTVSNRLDDARRRLAG